MLFRHEPCEQVTAKGTEPWEVRSFGQAPVADKLWNRTSKPDRRWSSQLLLTNEASQASWCPL